MAMHGSTDSSYDRTTISNMEFCSSLGPGVILVSFGRAGHSEKYGTPAAWLLDSNTSSGGRPDPTHTPCIWW